MLSCVLCVRGVIFMNTSKVLSQQRRIKKDHNFASNNAMHQIMPCQTNTSTATMNKLLERLRDLRRNQEQLRPSVASANKQAPRKVHSFIKSIETALSLQKSDSTTSVETEESDDHPWAQAASEWMNKKPLSASYSNSSIDSESSDDHPWAKACTTWMNREPNDEESEIDSANEENFFLFDPEDHVTEDLHGSSHYNQNGMCF